jgi:hypothetical protein
MNNSINRYNSFYVLIINVYDTKIFHNKWQKYFIWMLYLYVSPNCV